MKLKMFVRKYGSSMMAFVLTAFVTEMASRGCYFFAYQPKEPEGMKKFSRNK